MSKPRLLLCLQMWSGDRDAGNSLLRLIADLAPAKYDFADLLVSVQRDCPFDHDAINYAARLFSRTFTFRCVSSARGWPQGPNAQVTETWNYFMRNVRSGRFNHEGIWFIEPDGVPLRRTWLDEVYAEWVESPALILGFIGPIYKGTMAGHINGNLVARKAVDSRLPGWPNAPAGVAWDQHWDARSLPYAQSSRLIHSDYRCKLRDCDHLFEPRRDVVLGEVVRPAFLHGVKQYRVAHACVRSRLLPTEPPHHPAAASIATTEE